MKVVGGRGGHAVIHLMSGLAHSCPVLEIIDFSEVTSLCPESLIYLCYQDTFSGMCFESTSLYILSIFINNP